MLPEVCGPHGPFARCRTTTASNTGGDQQRHQLVPVAPVTPAPAGWWDQWWPDHTDTETATQLQYADVEQFVTTLFLSTFRRDPNAVGVTRWHWCNQWWNHDEAVHHLLNLWYLYETRAPQQRLIEFVRETYYLLPHLLGDAGPMRECQPSDAGPGAGRHIDTAIAPSLPLMANADEPTATNTTRAGPPNR